ncbi:hypothetical protein MHM98_02855 [Psychrobium sp. MM17-31]|uniref:GFA family protein n=1 Tax=Psychrobium sp. MM17-31 TaxID=2917758 RepID=UPI001EF4DEF2|nr:hypothetical protein [Psychrobium sp. MM17-31]MCG7530297.1 hypothetical protein [Psychrobium sp. MM17-31]
MHSYHGHCQCGDISLSISLPKPLDVYAPRRCDCDFCTSRQLTYLSEPAGQLALSVGGDYLVQQQGSGQAQFITCSSCDTVVTVALETSQGLIGALNSQMLAERERLASPLTVSPKLLAPQDKAQRWQENWLPLTINGLNKLTS